MSIRSYLHFIAFLLCAVLLGLTGCSGSPTAAQSGSQGGITAKLVWNAGKTSAKTLASAPAGVTTVRFAVSGPAMSTVQSDFAASAGTGTMTGIPSGTGITLTVYGLDAGANVIFQAVRSNLTVLPGQVTNVGTITLLPANVFFTGAVDDFTTSTGVPLSGVSVTTVGLAGSLGAEVTTTTDANGKFTVNGIPPTASFYLKLSKAGFADSYSNTFTTGISQDVSNRPYALYPPVKVTSMGNTAGNSVIRSRVVETSNQVDGYIGGAVVTATDTSNNTVYHAQYVDSTGTISSTLTSTDPANGSYVFVNLPAGHTFNVTASRSANDYSFNTRTFLTHADSVNQSRVVGTPTYSQSDLTGTWNMIIFRTGPDVISGITKGWVYVNATVDGSGNVTINTLLDSAGTTNTDIGGTINWALNASGLVTETGSAAFTSGKMKMSTDKKLVIGVASDVENSVNPLFRVAVKQDGTTFSNSDLAGPANWVSCAINSGIDQSWLFMQGTLSNGVSTQTSIIGPNGPHTLDTATTTLTIGANGVAHDSGNTGVWIFTPNKKMGFFVKNSDVNVYTFGVWSNLGQTYSLLDLNGAYTRFDVANDTPYIWEYEAGSLNAATNSVTSSSFLDSNGSTALSGARDATLVVTSTGLVTQGKNSSVNGFVSYDKRLMVMTSTWDPGIYSLSLILR